MSDRGCSVTDSEPPHLESEPGMNLDEARELGRQAAMEGRSAAPSLDPTIRREIPDAHAGSPASQQWIQLCRAFSAGYQAIRDAQAWAAIQEDQLHWNNNVKAIRLYHEPRCDHS